MNAQIGDFNGLTTISFPGQSQDVALVVAGVHGSELSGIEIAKWLLVLLSKKPETKRPRFTTIIVPELFPSLSAAARKLWVRIGSKKDDAPLKAVARWFPYSRPDGIQWIETNRQFPPPGQPLAFVDDKGAGRLVDADGKPLVLRTNPKKKNALTANIPLLRETRSLIELIEHSKPKRIASLHGLSENSWSPGVDAAGVFVDPRYVFDLATWSKLTQDEKWAGGTEQFKIFKMFDPQYPRMANVAKASYSAKEPDGRSEDDPLAYNIATAVESLRAKTVPGNQLSGALPIVHYAPPKGDQVVGFSLGDWGPVNAGNPGDANYRPGAPVITVEPAWDFESGAFTHDMLLVDDNLKPINYDPMEMRYLDRRMLSSVNLKTDRAAELRAFAQALLTVFLECK